MARSLKIKPSKQRLIEADLFHPLRCRTFCFSCIDYIPTCGHHGTTDYYHWSTDSNSNRIPLNQE